jgi:ATP-dependent Clp protease ATP-binding subunit ClpC
MFERFTDRARRVVVLAQEEARRLNHNYIGTEHLLLGMIREGEGVAARALTAMDISLDLTRQEVESVIGHGEQEPSGHIPFTPRSKKVLELSLRESQQLGHHYIGTEHLLLGMAREGEGVAAQILGKLGAGRERIRHHVIELLRGGEGETGAEAGTSPAGIHAFESGERAEAGPAAGRARAPFGYIVARLDEVVTRLDEIAGRLSSVERLLAGKGEAAAQPQRPADEGEPPGTADEAEPPGGEQAG